MAKWKDTQYDTLEKAHAEAIVWGEEPSEIIMEPNPKGLTYIMFFTTLEGTKVAQKIDCLTGEPISKVKELEKPKPQRRSRRSRKQKRARKLPRGSKRYDPRNNLRASRWTVDPKFHSFRDVERHFRDDFRQGEFDTHLILTAVAKDGTSYEFRQDEETDPWTIEERVLYKPLYREVSEVQQQFGPAMTYRGLLEHKESKENS